MRNKKCKKIIKMFLIVLIGPLLWVTSVMTSIFLLIFLVSPHSYKSEIYINWKIKLPDYKEKYEIFRFDYREGQDFVILEYEKTDELIKTDEYQKVSKDNVDKLKTLIEKYYNSLDADEKNKFDKNVDVEYLWNEENYFLYKTKQPRPDDRFIIIIVGENNRVYVLEFIM